MALVDVNPMGKVVDVKSLGRTALTLAAFQKCVGGLELIEDRGREIDVRVVGQEFNLRVERVMGGNQWNVLNNLRVLNEAGFPSLEVEAHFGLGTEEAVARKSLYLPGCSKIDLETPEGPGQVIFDKRLKEKNIVISSAPHGESGQAWWRAWERFLLEDKSCSYYWNPARKQLDGGVPGEVRRRLHGRVAIFQVNEREAQQYLNAYASGAQLKDLPEVVGAEWTVITRAEKGMRLYAGGEVYEEEVI